MSSDTEINNYVSNRNAEKVLFSAGPASLLSDNILGLRPCFGRGDNDYLQIEESVLSKLKRMSGHDHIVRLQGSASLALEIMARNFLHGRILVISTGYYSDRLLSLSEISRRNQKEISDIEYVDWKNIDSVTGNYDWVFSCSTETSCGLGIKISELKKVSSKLNAKLMLDATASIGLEGGHEYADVMAYSSCKGLFGLTGAAFIAYNANPTVEVDSFYLKMSTHVDKGMTGPYHSICSLYHVLEKHDEYREAVKINKDIFCEKMERYLTLPQENQPLLCTHVSCNIISNDLRAVLYKPRINNGGSVVCHLGEVHMMNHAKGEIFDLLEISE